VPVRAAAWFRQERVQVKKKKFPNYTEKRWNFRRAVQGPPGLSSSRAWVLKGAQRGSLSKPLKALEVIRPALVHRLQGAAAHARAQIPAAATSPFTEAELGAVETPCGPQLDVPIFNSHLATVRQQVAHLMRRDDVAIREMELLPIPLRPMKREESVAMTKRHRGLMKGVMDGYKTRISVLPPAVVGMENA
jgi:hypothetical protein